MASVASRKTKSVPEKIEELPKFAITSGSPFLTAEYEPKSIIEKLGASKDLRKTALELLGNLDGLRVVGNKLLVCTYIVPDKRTASGLFISKETMKESVWQGTVGFVVKKGSMAFKDDEATKAYFHGEDVQHGDWVVFKAGDSKRVQIRGVDCRWVEDVLIDAVVADPNMITHEKV